MKHIGHPGLRVREIRGDIVLDRSAFAAAPGSPADFDGDPTRPYNVQPEALLLMGRTQLMLKDRTSAHATFRELIARYPKSGSAQQAQRFLAGTGG